MNRIDLAVRSFFWIFLNRKFADRVNEHFTASVDKKELQSEVPEIKETVKERSGALQLLALFQREGRLIDFLKEPIDGYNDAQIGAAVRDIHRDCSALLSRLFSIEPLEIKEEGSQMVIPQGFSPEQYHLTGNVTSSPPYNGILRHHGWKASKVDLPVWKGNADAASVIAPAEVELP